MRRIFLRALLVPLLCGPTLSGCNPIHYSPNTRNVPLPALGGDVAVAGLADGNRIEAQAAWSPTDALSLQLNGGIFDRGDEDDDEDGGSGRFLELGAGYVAPMGEHLAWGVVGAAADGPQLQSHGSRFQTGRVDAHDRCRNRTRRSTLTIPPASRSSFHH